jgi:hypothetical protein
MNPQAMRLVTAAGAPHDPHMGFGVTSLAVLLAVLATATPAWSQGRLRVTVLDAGTRRPVAGALLLLADASRSSVTGVEGLQSFTDVPPGPQHLAVRRLGYRPRVLHVFVGSEGTLDLVVILEPVPVRLLPLRVETPRVIAARDEDAQAAPSARQLSRAAMGRQPLLAEPDALLATTGGHVAARPESPGGLHVMGGASDHLAFRLDGLPVRSPYHAAAVTAALNPDVLDRVELQVSPAFAALADALSGVLSWHTRAVPVAVQWAGGLSVSQARLMLDTPLSRPGSGLLLGGRLLFPGIAGQKREPAHIDGDGRDGVARLVIPWRGGTLRVLGYDTRSDVALERVVPDLAGRTPAGRNEFEWSSQTVGGRWERSGVASTVAFGAWRLSSAANATWHADSLPRTLDTGMEERGVDGSIRRRRGPNHWQLRAQLTHRRSTYLVRTGDNTSDLGVSGWLLALQPQVTRDAGRATWTAGAHTWLGTGGVEPSPFVEWTWRPTVALSLSAEGSRRVQYTQSLRNGEAMTALLFPADLPVTAGRDVPVARSDQLVMAASWRPSPARRLAVRGWWRRLANLALPAIGTDAPFALGPVARGSGVARGASIDATASGTRWTLMGSYGAQRVQLTARDTTWQPESGVSHTADAGIIAFPTSSSSLRVGATAGAGRRVTGFGGAFEWEACNLLDRGCEFAGTPVRGDAPLGGLAIPAWVRVDAGVRTHWHVRVGQRDVLLAAHATWSNVFNRRNVLTYARDGDTGRRTAVAMRPSAPLVFGIDWSY